MAVPAGLALFVSAGYAPAAAPPRSSIFVPTHLPLLAPYLRVTRGCLALPVLRLSISVLVSTGCVLAIDLAERREGSALVGASQPVRYGAIHAARG